MSDLKKCPFCGKQHELEIIEDFHWGNSKAIICNRRVLFSAYYKAEEIGIVTQFNSRPIEDELQEKISKLMDRIKELEEAVCKQRLYSRVPSMHPNPRRQNNG